MIHSLSQLEGIEDISLTTNGSLLKQNAKALKQAGLSRLTVSLDTIDPAIFATMIGRKIKIQDVLDGIDHAAEIGFEPIKINAVVQKRVNCHKILDLAEYFKNRGHVVRFIEFMDVGNQNDWDMKHVVASSHLLDKIQKKHEVISLEPNYFGEVASRYAYKDNGVEFGFISSVTNPFCQSCTRARLSTDGKIYTCLFATEGYDLREYLRSHTSDEKILASIRESWKKRSDQYSRLRSQGKAPDEGQKVEMFHIGG